VARRLRHRRRRTGAPRQTGGNGAYTQRADAPLTTIVSKNEHLVVAPYMVPRYGEDPDPRRGGGAGQAPRAIAVDRPMPTIVPTQNGAQLVAAFMAKHYGGHETPGSPLGMPATRSRRRTITPSSRRT
jgi:DNA (cytosine-5)-methyltransferase 1